jgi:3-oxoacyl-[acyl-carrier protein] reductase
MIELTQNAEQRHVLVTGASRGIGKAIAIKLAEQGFSILAHYKSNKEGAQQTQEEIQQKGGSARLVCFDISDRNQCDEILTSYIKEHGAFYGIVNNAGIARDVVFPSMGHKDWDQVIRTNLDSFYNVIQPCTLPMIQRRRGGRIITLASISGLVGNRGQVNYSAAKAGIIGATKSLALELAKRKITVNCIAPGVIKTDMISELPLDEVIKQIPTRRVGTTKEVAGLVSYLMSDIAAYVTRQVISINGGMV